MIVNFNLRITDKEIRMMATVFIHPIDLVKNRMQLGGKHQTSLQVIRGVVNSEGPLAFYRGISAGLFRQATYTTTRLGIYTWLLETFASADGRPPGFFGKAAIAMTAGVVGAFVEVALIRMTADGRLPAAERRNYKHVFDAFLRMTKEEGVLTLWRGAIPTMGRAVVVNAAQLATYSQAKQLLLSTGYFEQNIGLHFGSAMISGLVTTTVSTPVDIAKTRIQNMKSINGKPEFTGAVDVLTKIVKKEGPLALWKGIVPYYARVGPHTLLMFIFLEQLNSYYTTYVLGITDKKKDT